MNVVDSLIITLGLDPSGFTKGQKDAAAAQAKLKADGVASGKSIEDANAKAGESVAALGRKFLGLYVLLTAGKGVQQFISEITAADAALGRTAKNLDMSGRNLSAWQNAAAVAGGSAEGITGTLKGLTSEMQKAALTGQSGIIPVFRALGINLADASGKARDAGDVLVDLNRKAQGMDPAKFSELAHMAGIDDGTIALLEKATAEFDKLRAEQQKYAASAKDIDAAQQRQSGWSQLLITSQSVGRTILTAVTPAIVGAMKAIQDWANANQDWIKTAIVEKVQQFAEYIKGIDWTAVKNGIAGFVDNIKSISSAIEEAVKFIDSDSVLSKGLEALAVLAGVRLVSSLTGLTGALRILGATPVPSFLARMLGMATGVVGSAAGIAAGAIVVASTVPANKDEPTINPDGSMGYTIDGKSVSREDYLRAHGRADLAGGTAKPPTDERNIWQRIMPKWLGGADPTDPKVKDGIDDIAKATGETRDILKAQKDGVGAGTNAEGGIGGAIPNLRYGPHHDTPGSAAVGGGDGGTRSWRNNNPGNISAGEFSKAHGADGSDGRFAHFPSYEAGRKAQEDLWFNSSTYKDLTLAQAVAKWSPSGENDTAGIIRQYSGAAGVDANTLLSQFTPAQRGKLLDAQQAREGWRAGTRQNGLSGPGSTGTGDVVDRAQGMVGLREGQAANALGHIMHAGEWCADFVNGTIEANGGKGSGNAMARSFMNWGKAVSLADAKRGDVAVLNNGGHVGFFTGEKDKDGRIGIVAGNTRDSRGGHDVEHYFVDPSTVYGARRGNSIPIAPVVPTPTATIDHAVSHIVRGIAGSKSVKKDGDKPMAVTPVDRNGNPLAAAAEKVASISRMTRLAASGGGTIHHTVNHNVETHVGEMHVKTPATDGKQFAGEFRHDMMRRGDVVQANGALAAIACCAIFLPWLIEHGMSVSLSAVHTVV